MSGVKLWVSFYKLIVLTAEVSGLISIKLISICFEYDFSISHDFTYQCFSSSNVMDNRKSLDLPNVTLTKEKRFSGFQSAAGISHFLSDTVYVDKTHTHTQKSIKSLETKKFLFIFFWYKSVFLNNKQIIQFSPLLFLQG